MWAQAVGRERRAAVGSQLSWKVHIAATPTHLQPPHRKVSSSSSTAAGGSAGGPAIAAALAAKKSKEAKLNQDRALTRAEFIECLVRIAVAKYVHGGCTEDVSSAVTMLCEQNLRAHLTAEATCDSNDFRKERLYNAEADAALRSFRRLLSRITRSLCCAFSGRG